MTINVSVRVPDGIVLASDSLATTLLPLQQPPLHGQVNCPQCKSPFPLALQLPAIAIPGKSTPLAYKVFYVGNYGLMFFGAASLNGRTLFNHVMDFRRNHYKAPMGLEDVVSSFATIMQAACMAESSTRQLPQGTLIGGFQACGYDHSDLDYARRIVVEFTAGMDANWNSFPATYDVAVTGDSSVARKLSAATVPGVRDTELDFHNMSLADAIDYAKFLVQTTADFHRFTTMVPTVGGPVDVAVITKWTGFKWVQRKKLLDDDDATRINIGKVAHEVAQLRRDMPAIVTNGHSA